MDAPVCNCISLSVVRLLAARVSVNLFFLLLFSRQHLMMCCSLANVPNKSPVVTPVPPDPEKPVPEDEEKLLHAAEDNESS